MAVGHTDRRLACRPKLRRLEDSRARGRQNHRRGARRACSGREAISVDHSDRSPIGSQTHLNEDSEGPRRNAEDLNVMDGDDRRLPLCRSRYQDGGVFHGVVARTTGSGQAGKTLSAHPSQLPHCSEGSVSSAAKTLRCTAR